MAGPMLKCHYGQIFTSWFLWKNENAVCRLQISALVPEIFKFEKCVRYANEMTDDVIHSTHYYIMCINRDILANLQCRLLKLGRLIVLQKHNYRFRKFCCHGNALFSSPHPLDFHVAEIFSSKNVLQCHKLKLTHLYACWIMYIRHHLQIWKLNVKGG